jgi:hypothetical protein
VLFLEMVDAAFDRFSDGMAQAAKAARGLRTPALMVSQYHNRYHSCRSSKLCCVTASGVRDLVWVRLADMWTRLQRRQACTPLR